MSYYPDRSDGAGSRRRDREHEAEDHSSRYDSGYSGRRDVYPAQPPYGDSDSSSAYQSSPPKGRAGVAPVYSPPSDKPPIPAGWVPQWDDHYQRWFYYDTTTGYSQWEAPGYVLPRLPLPGTPGRSFDRGYGYGEETKKRSGHGGMLLGAAGGVAAGALLTNALRDDSDDEYRSYPRGAPLQAPAYAGSVSSSDSEPVDEPRREYAYTRDDARSSSESSSDREEAREEYYSDEEDEYGSD